MGWYWTPRYRFEVLELMMLAMAYFDQPSYQTTSASTGRKDGVALLCSRETAGSGWCRVEGEEDGCVSVTLADGQCNVTVCF